MTAAPMPQGLVTAFDTRQNPLGLKLTHQTALATSQCGSGNTGNVDQYPALATTIKSSKAPVTFYAGYYCDFALLAKALRTAGYTGRLMSDDGSLDPHYVSEAGAKVANGTYISCACADLTSAAAADAVRQGVPEAGQVPGRHLLRRKPMTPLISIIHVMKSLGTNVTRAGDRQRAPQGHVQGLDEDGAFPGQWQHRRQGRLHLQREERQDRRRGLGPLTLAK